MDLALPYLAALALATVWSAALIWTQGQGLSPDGAFYRALARGEAVPRPYAYRWLAPWLLGPRQETWAGWLGVCLTISVASLVWVTPGSARQGVFIVALFLGLPMVRLWLRLPVLVDASAFAAGLGAWIAFRSGEMALGVGLSLVAGAFKESAPIFIAAWSLNPLALLGLAAVPWWRKGSPAREAWLTQPWQAARQTHQGMNPVTLLLPWGMVAIVAPLGATQVGLWALVSAGLSLSLGYAQLLRSQDAARLYQWAFPALIPLIVAGTPEAWLVLVAGLHLLAQPYRGA